MISEIGLLFLTMGLVASSLSFFELIYKRFVSHTDYFDQVRLTNVIFLFILSSFLCLTYSFIKSDFTLDVISENSNSQLPIIYKITGVWGNHEGSILLWLLVMSFFGFIFSNNSSSPPDFKRAVLRIQNSLSFLISSFVVFTSNPFSKTFPPVVEGADLNPLLQDLGLAIHPPFLYLGYVGFSIIYSISIVALSN